MPTMDAIPNHSNSPKSAMTLIYNNKNKRTRVSFSDRVLPTNSNSFLTIGLNSNPSFSNSVYILVTLTADPVDV